MTSRELLQQIVDYYTLPLMEFEEKHPVTDFAMHPLRDDVHERVMKLLDEEYKASVAAEEASNGK